MNLKDAYEKLPEYVDGELSAKDKQAFERLLSREPELREALAGMRQLETMLRRQTWIEPSYAFTENVLERIATQRAAQIAAVAEKQPARAYERALFIIPAMVLAALLLPFVRSIGDSAMDALRDIGFWLGSMTGIPFFATYPIILLGIFAPLFAGAVASCAITGKCRLTRALTT